MKKIKKIALILFFFILSSNIAFGDNCEKKYTINDSLNKSDIAFMGEITNIEEIEKDNFLVNFTIDVVLKGPLIDDISFNLNKSELENYNFKEDNNYIVYGEKKLGNIALSPCYKTSLLNDDSISSHVKKLIGFLSKDLKEKDKTINKEFVFKNSKNNLKILSYLVFSLFIVLIFLVLLNRIKKIK